MTSRNYEPPTQLGSTIPANEPHAVSVTLPKWKDNIDYEEGAARVTSQCNWVTLNSHSSHHSKVFV
ncbi:unnamed protein product [Umbelopsis ramanniana]